MSLKATRIFKAKEWEKCSKESTDCLWDVEIDYTYDSIPVEGENRTDVSFIVDNCWRKITLLEKSTYNYSSKDGAELKDRLYKLNVLDKSTGEITKYKLVKDE